MEDNLELSTNVARPKEVIRGVIFLSASLLLGMLRSVLILRQRTSGRTLIIAGAFNLIFVAVCFLIVKLIAAGHNWARMVVLVLIGLLILSIPIVFVMVPSAFQAYFNEFRANIFLGILGVIISLFQLAGLYELFTRNSNQWFKAQK